VLASYHDKGLGKRPPSKLHTRWEGPFRVVNITDNENQYSLQNFLDGKITDRHITDLKLFHFDPDNPLNMSLNDIAIRDRIHEFPVEAVLEHYINVVPTGQRVKASDLSFKIKWQGFSEKWNTIEPFKNVRLNDKLHEYLRTHNLKRFIPRNLSGEDERVINRIVTFKITSSTDDYGNNTSKDVNSDNISTDIRITSTDAREYTSTDEKEVISTDIERNKRKVEHIIWKKNNNFSVTNAKSQLDLPYGQREKRWMPCKKRRRNENNSIEDC